MFKTGDKTDFERMLDDILSRAKTQALQRSAQVEAEAAKHGSLLSSGTPILMEQRLTPIHESALADAMRLIVQLSERTGIPISELSETTKSKLTTFTSDMTERMATAANRMSLTQLLTQARERFDHRVENALKDVGIGFIQGRSAIVTENSTTQSKAMRLLEALYRETRDKYEPAMIDELRTGLTEEEAQTAWRYLKDRGLIQTYSIPYTARVNAAGIDAIEGAQRRPDQPSASFPSVSYNIVHNTVNVGTLSNSPVQQAGIHSTQNQTITYSTQDIGDLARIVKDVTSHLDELRLEDAQKRKAEAQLATLNAQLSDDPDPVIVRQAGRTLRNIIEGAIGSLAATAVQPTVWVWVYEAMRRLFG